MLCKIDLTPSRHQVRLRHCASPMIFYTSARGVCVWTYTRIFHWDLHAHRVLPLPQAAASFRRVSRGDIAGIRVRHFAESEKNRNAHVAERRASPSKTEVTCVATATNCSRRRRRRSRISVVRRASINQMEPVVIDPGDLYCRARSRLGVSSRSLHRSRKREQTERKRQLILTPAITRRGNLNARTGEARYFRTLMSMLILLRLMARIYPAM